MSHEPLFYKSPLAWSEWDMHKYAQERGFKLPEDEAKWSQSITSYVASNLPYLSKHPVEVAIDDKEVKMGYAKGRLVVDGGKVTIPIIIRDFNLLPLDVFIHEEQFIPLSEKSVEEVMMNKSLGVKPISRKGYKGENTNLERSSTPPRSAYTHGNAGYKVGHIIDKLSVSEEDVKAFRAKIASDQSLSIAMFQNGKKFMDKLAKADVIPEGGHPEESLENQVRKIAKSEEWPCNVIQLQKVATEVPGENSWVYNRVGIYTSSDYYPMAYEYQEMEMTKAASLFGEEVMEKVSSDGVHTVVLGRGGFTFNTPAEMQFPIETMEKFGQYDAVSQNNRIVRGFFIPEVFDYGMNKVAEMKLFTSKDCFSMQEKIAGRKVYAGPRAELPSSDIREGITGTFIFRYGEKTAALEPFRVSSFPLESGEQTEFDAFSTRGEAMHFTVMPGLAAATPGEKRGHYLIPSFWQFVRVGDHEEPMLSKQGETAKYAGEDKRLEIMWDGINYTIRGSQVENISQQLFDLDGMKARFFLTAFGVVPDHADELLKRAKRDGHAKFEATVKPTGNYEVVTNSIKHRDGSVDTKYAAMSEKVIMLMRESALIKEALAAPDEETVDKVLALNFTTKENLQEFVESIDDYKEAQSKLARLLVASRLGIKQVDPQSIKTAMDNLSNVIEGLEILKSSSTKRKK